MALVYFIGSMAVIIYNYENIIPSIVAIVGDVFTGTAAVGGFLGGSIAFAFNRGVNRGLFSNEAGQGSAPLPTQQPALTNRFRKDSSLCSNLLSTPSSFVR
jgi:AGCS family alanine or glycine:cation symporter